MHLKGFLSSLVLAAGFAGGQAQAAEPVKVSPADAYCYDDGKKIQLRSGKDNEVLLEARHPGARSTQLQPPGTREKTHKMVSVPPTDQGTCLVYNRMDQSKMVYVRTSRPERPQSP